MVVIAVFHSMLNTGNINILHFIVICIEFITHFWTFWLDFAFFLVHLFFFYLFIYLFILERNSLCYRSTLQSFHCIFESILPPSVYVHVAAARTIHYRFFVPFRSVPFLEDGWFLVSISLFIFCMPLLPLYLYTRLSTFNLDISSFDLVRSAYIYTTTATITNIRNENVASKKEDELFISFGPKFWIA